VSAAGKGVHLHGACCIGRYFFDGRMQELAGERSTCS
jgi:hypothetical protein